MKKQKLDNKSTSSAATINATTAAAAALNRINDTMGASAAASSAATLQNDAAIGGKQTAQQSRKSTGARVPLNFSIESIMQPHHNNSNSNHHQHHNHHNQQVNNLNLNLNSHSAAAAAAAAAAYRSIISQVSSRSRSRSRSPPSSARSSPGALSSEHSGDRSSCASGASGQFDQLNRQHQQHQQHQQQVISRASSIRSTVSTPISPGGGIDDDDDDGVDEDHDQYQDDKDNCCDTSESLRLKSNLNGASSVNCMQQEVATSRFNYNDNNNSGSQMHQMQQQQKDQQVNRPQQQQQQQHRQSSGKGARNSNQSGGGGGSANHLLRQPVCTDPRLAPFKCHLDNLDLWHRFHPLDTEMIITKQGRRMFPPVRVTFSLDDDSIAAINNQSQQQHQQQHQGATTTGAPGVAPFQLNPRDKYQVLMDILPYDNKRYRYAYHKSSWQQAGKADPPSPTKLFLHPDGPFTLDQLKRQSVISFEKIKLTNNDANKHGYIVLNSMHKYQPRIHLALWRGKESLELANAPISQLDHEPHKTFIFSETIFTAVTAYQNHSITKLKIDSNPFAKGFRDSTRLTDLELESMQDLISDGQCPFSPPRAPPPGFPHFLFSAAAAAAAFGQPAAGQHHLAHPHAHLGHHPHAHQQHQHQAGPPQLTQPGEDAAAALLRERTIMALDSFFQQQQQQQQQHLQSSSSSLDSPNSHGTPHSQQASRPLPQSTTTTTTAAATTATTQQHANINNSNNNNNSSNNGGHQTGAGHFSPFLQAATNQHQHQHQLPNGPNGIVTSTGGATGHGCNSSLGRPPSSQANQLEQFIMQQQHQLAAAMAAAAAAAQQHQHHQHHQHHQQHPFQSLFADQQQLQVQLNQQQRGGGSPQLRPTSGSQASGKTPLTTGACRLSPPRSGATGSIDGHGQQQLTTADPSSPIGAAKSAARNQMLTCATGCDSAALTALSFLAPPPPPAVLNCAQNPAPITPNAAATAPTGAPATTTTPTSLSHYGPFQAQAQAHLQALMMHQQQQQHHHQQQMATLSMQNCLQAAPAIALSNSVGLDQSHHNHQQHQHQNQFKAQHQHQQHQVNSATSGALKIQREKKSPGRV